MSYIAIITDDSHPDATPLWESDEQPTAPAAYALAEQHIHQAQPGDVIAPVDDSGRYVIWNHTQGPRAAQVATLTISAVDSAPDTQRDPRVVGGRYHSHYWDLGYTVNAIAFDHCGSLTSITVTDADGTRSHGTAWDPRDEILFDPRTDKAHP